MKPGKQNLELYQGDFFDFFFRLRTSTYNTTTLQYEAGDYLNLTGWTPKAQIRSTYLAAGGVLLAEFAASLGNQDAYPGSVYLSLTDAQTALLKAPPEVVKNTYKWDVQLTDTDGKPRTYLAGSVSVLPQVTDL